MTTGADTAVISFRPFGFPVKVNASFLVVAFLLPLGTRPGRWLIAWVLTAFAGVLVHELGHAFTARAFGEEPSIELHAFGGHTSYDAAEGRPSASSGGGVSDPAVDERGGMRASGFAG